MTERECVIGGDEMHLREGVLIAPERSVIRGGGTVSPFSATSNPGMWEVDIHVLGLHARVCLASPGMRRLWRRGNIQFATFEHE
jgi:hypothetical protein